MAIKKRRPISLGLFPWIADTIYQLATNSIPPIVLQFREEILAEKIKAELREGAENHPERLAVLQEQLNDGSWPAPEGTKDEEVFFVVTRKMLQLHDLGVRKDSDAVKGALEFLRTVQGRDGAFPLHIHHTAFTLWVLGIQGLGKSPVAKKALKYLEKCRRKDCGWLDPGLEATLVEDEDSPSCAWTTLHALLALTEYPDLRRNMDVRRGAVLLLDGMFKRNHKSFFGHPDHWRELDYGYEGTACLKWAIPKVLLVLGRLGCGPETKEVTDLLEFMKRTLRPSGRWGASLEGSDFLTLRVLRSLMAVQEASGD